MCRINIVYPILNGWRQHMNCECNYSTGRSFLTRQEKIEMLKEYKSYLDKEAQGVAEKIKEMEKAA